MNDFINSQKIYVLLDEHLIEQSHKTLQNIVLPCIDAGIEFFQYRYKNVCDKILMEKILSILELLRNKNVELVINDNVAIAASCDICGVHVGENDLPVSLARKLLPHSIVGATASNLETAMHAQADGADYIGYGAFFGTNTKHDTKIGNLKTLNNMCETLKIPVFAIGGINEKNVHIIAETRCRNICVGSGIIFADNIFQTIENLKKALS